MASRDSQLPAIRVDHPEAVRNAVIPLRRMSFGATPNVFDQEADREADPCAGWEIGPCQVIRSLTPGGSERLAAFRADHSNGSRLVVMKRLELPEQSLMGFGSHAEWAAGIRHPNLAQVYPAEVSEKGNFWVTEYTSGATLAEILDACRKKGKSIPLGLLLACVHEAGLALGSLHARASSAHGMINDHNLQATFEGSTRVLNVGLVRCTVGTPLWPDALASMKGFLPPEQMPKWRAAEPRSDVFSLGAVLYEGLVGKRLADTSDQAAHRMDVPSKLNISVGKELDQVVMRALNRDRSQRNPSATEFSKDLRRVATPFVWRTSQRSDFLRELFPVRERRERVLLAGFAPEPTPAPERKPTPSPRRRAKSLSMPLADLFNAEGSPASNALGELAPEPTQLNVRAPSLSSMVKVEATGKA
ncbi:MAG: protein kinase domain-containing protein, partial [Myxococcaceae bacterium]